MTHPPASRLAGYQSPDMPARDRLALDDHLATCAACRERLLDAERLRGAVAHLRADLAEADPAAAPSWLRSPSLGAWAAALLVAAAAGAWLTMTGPGIDRPTAGMARREPAVRAPAPAETSPRAEQALVVDEGGPIGLGSDGHLEGLPASWPAALASRVHEVLTSGHLRVGSAALELRARRGRLRSTDRPPAFELVGPVGTVLEADRPVFRWRPLAGATAYTVTVYDSRFREVARSPAVAGTQWQPARPLRRGAAWSWQVTALQDGREVTVPEPPEPEARFRVLDATRARELDEARQATPSHLLRSVLYAEAGLLDQAQAELHALAALNPGSPLVRRWLEDLPAPGPR